MASFSGAAVCAAVLFKAKGSFIERTFLVEHFLEPTNAVDFVLDASPWGFGGILSCNQVPIEYFTSALGSEDVARFNFEAEAKFHGLREFVKAGATSAQPSFVHNTVSSVWHRFARGGLDTPPAQWQTVHGWCCGLQSSCEILSTVQQVRLSVADASEISGREFVKGTSDTKRQQLDGFQKGEI